MFNSVVRNISIFLFVLIGFLFLFFVIVLIKRFVKMKSLRFKPEVCQLGELIQKNFFVCRDAYRLNWYGEINKQGKIILLAIHDLGMNGEMFNLLRQQINAINTSISLVSYDQRNFGKNQIEKKRNFGSTIVDLYDVISSLKELFPDQEIVLLAEGYGIDIALETIVKYKLDQRLIGSSIRRIDPYFSKLKTKNLFLRGMMMSSDSIFQISGSGKDLTNSEELAKTVDVNLAKSSLSIREYIQLKTLSKRMFKNIKKLNKLLVIFQPQNSIYIEQKEMNELIDHDLNNKLKIQYFEDKKHFLFQDLDHDSVIEKLLQTLTIQDDNK